MGAFMASRRMVLSMLEVRLLLSVLLEVLPEDTRRVSNERAGGGGEERERGGRVKMLAANAHTRRGKSALKHARRGTCTHRCGTGSAGRRLPPGCA